MKKPYCNKQSAKKWAAARRTRTVELAILHAQSWAARKVRKRLAEASENR